MKDFSTDTIIKTGHRKLGKRQKQYIARRKQIIETALALFAKNGFDATSTKKLANSIGISEGLIFHYFPTKAHLLTAVLETHHDFVCSLRKILENEKANPVGEVLPKLATSWLNNLRQEAPVTLVLFSAAQTNEVVNAVLQKVIADGVTALSAYLKTRIKAGELRSDLPVENSAFMVLSLLMIFLINNRFLPEEEWDIRSAAFIKDVISVWLQGACV